MVTGGQTITALSKEECYFKNKRKNKRPVYTQTPFCCMLLMEMQMDFYQSSVINQTHKVSHTTPYVLVANALSNSDPINYITLICQEKIYHRDM
jgi:hypothetical protein